MTDALVASCCSAVRCCLAHVERAGSVERVVTQDHESLEEPAGRSIWVAEAIARAIGIRRIDREATVGVRPRRPSGGVLMLGAVCVAGSASERRLAECRGDGLHEGARMTGGPKAGGGQGVTGPQGGLNIVANGTDDPVAEAVNALITWAGPGRTLRLHAQPLKSRHVDVAAIP